MRLTRCLLRYQGCLERGGCRQLALCAYRLLFASKCNANICEESKFILALELEGKLSGKKELISLN